MPHRVAHHQRPPGPNGKTPPYSAAVRAGDFVFVSGQLPRDANGNPVEGDIGAQTRQTLANVVSALALAGCTLDHVVKFQVWLADLNDFDGFNAAYLEVLGDRPLPARATVQSRVAFDAPLEIDCVAYNPLP